MRRTTATTDYLKECMGTALLELMKEKPIEKISIEEMTAKADVGRSTYFRYFKSKDEVLSFKITCLWKRFSDEHGATNFATGSYDGIRLFFEFCLSTRPICDLLYSADRQYVILNFYLQEAASIVANADAKTHYFIQFITYGLFGLMNAWVLRGYKDTTAEEASVHGFEDKNVFEGCMPVEVMARRGHDTLCYGPLKPRGLRDPKTGKEPYAVVQLRRDNAQGSVYNLVGFQTHLRFPEQKRVFSMIPALHDAEFVRYGVMHRNTYLRSPGMLDRYYRLIADDRIAFAGQMTGVEGYIESAASGFLAGIEMARRLEGKPPVDFPRETAIGALGLYISDTTVSDFQPMNVNFGIMPPLGYRIKGGKRVKNAQLAARSLEKIDAMREDVLSDRKGE